MKHIWIEIRMNTYNNFALVKVNKMLIISRKRNSDYACPFNATKKSINFPLAYPDAQY